MLINIHIKSIPIIEPSSIINTSDQRPSSAFLRQALCIVDAGLLVSSFNTLATRPVGANNEYVILLSSSISNNALVEALFPVPPFESTITMLLSQNVLRMFCCSSVKIPSRHSLYFVHSKSNLVEFSILSFIKSAILHSAIYVDIEATVCSSSS